MCLDRATCAQHRAAREMGQCSRRSPGYCTDSPSQYKALQYVTLNIQPRVGNAQRSRSRLQTLPLPGMWHQELQVRGIVKWSGKCQGACTALVLAGTRTAVPGWARAGALGYTKQRTGLSHFQAPVAHAQKAGAASGLQRACAGLSRTQPVHAQEALTRDPAPRAASPACSHPRGRPGPRGPAGESPGRGPTCLRPLATPRTT